MNIPFFNFKKGKTEEKETPIREADNGAVDSTFEEDFVVPEDQRISPSIISQLYDQSNLLKRYIKIIVDELIRYEFKAIPLKDTSQAKKRAEEINKLLLQANKMETFKEVREKYIKDLYLYGRAGVEIQPTKNSDRIDAIYAVPGYAIRVNTDKTGGNFKDDQKAYKVLDPNNTSDVAAEYPYDSFMFLVLDQLSDKVYGSNPINSIYFELLADMKASKNLAAGANSVKSGVLCFPKAPRSLIRDAVGKLVRLVKKNSKAKIVAVNTDGKFLDLSNLNPKDNVELQRWLVNKANVFNIPPFKLGLADSGGLNAREQVNDFRALIESVIKYELDKLNSILLYTKLSWFDVQITCPDLSTKLSYERTRIAVRLVNGRIITPNEARVKYLGLNKITDDPKADQLQIPENERSNENTSTGATQADKGINMDIFKPFPNEHSCRLREPSEFKSGTFRRVKRRRGEQEYSIIMGELIETGSVVEQSYRYHKSEWSEDGAKGHCKTHGGRFEGAKKDCECDKKKGYLGKFDGTTSIDKDHYHIYQIDGNGNGITGYIVGHNVPEALDHTHDIMDHKIQVAHEHIHELIPQ